MIIITNPTTIQEIKEKHNNFFDNLVKIVIDIEKETIAIDAELHADLESYLLENDSEQQNLWGANIYIDKPNFIEFTSLINIRPNQNNRSMEIQDDVLKIKIQNIVKKFITW